MPATTLLHQVAVTAILIGRAQPFGPNGEPSAIDKRAVAGSLLLSPAGIVGDEQADTRHHGGPDKAVHHYPAEHYQAWHQEMPQLPASHLQVGGFGENFSSSGLIENDVCIGDVFQIGNAVLQVSQARQPCWKLSVRFGVPDMARRVQDTARTGWYYRVLEAGEVMPGMQLRLLERPHPDWTLSRLLHHLYVDPLNETALHAIAALPALAASWQAVVAQRRCSGQIEDWSRRLNIPRYADGVEKS